MHRTFPIVVAVLALATAGCGGSDETSPGTRESTFSMATPPPSDKKTLAEKIDGEPNSVDIGSGSGVMIQGKDKTGKDKTKPIESSEVIFTQGRAVIDLEIDSDAGKPTSSDELLELARKQAALVAAGLPG